MEPTLTVRLDFPTKHNAVLTQDEDMNSSIEISRELRWSIAMSVIMIGGGVLAIVVPLISGLTATILIGSLLAVAGAAHLPYAWHMRSSGGYWWGTLLGILCLATGACLLVNPRVGLVSLTMVLATWLVMEAVLEFILAYYLHPLRGSGWLVLDGIIMLAIAILVCLTWPGNADWVIGTLVGLSIVCCGIARLMLSLAARCLTKALFTESQRELA